MAKHSLTHLWNAPAFNRREILQPDLYIGMAGGLAGVAIGIIDPAALLRADGAAAVLLGVIIGAVVAGVAILAAFMDQSFLRKLAAINRNPVRYLAPFLFTAVLGVFASLSLIVLSVLSDHSAHSIIAIVGVLASFLTVWTIASLLPCLSTMVQFMGLKIDALDVPEDEDSRRS
jgi:hypothetical protein